MTTSPMPIMEAAEHYLERKRRRGAAANTLKAYGADLAQFAEFLDRLDQGRLVSLISQHHVSRWLDDLAARGISQRSQARKLAVLRGFVRHARAEGWIGHDPTADERVSFRQRRVIAPELDRLLAIIDAIPVRCRDGLRDRAMLRLALDCGLRISEVAGVDVPGAGSQTSIDLHRKLAHVVGKGGDIESIGFDDTTRSMVERWLCVRPNMAGPTEPALFVNRGGSRISRQSLHSMLKRRAAAAGVERMHWHLMRHRRISHVVERCGLKVAQQFARHARIETTGLYGCHADGVARELVRQRAGLEQGRAAA